MNSTRSLANKTVVRYVIAGGLSYAIELFLIILLARSFGLSDSTSVAIAFWFGLTIAFVLQKLFAFKDKAAKFATSQAALYTVLVMFNYLFTVSLVFMLSNLMDVAISRTIALLITTVWNYFIYKKVIFKQRA